MAIMENMTEAELIEMQEAFEEKIKAKNSEATFTPFKMPADKPREIEKLEDKINNLTTQVSLLEQFIKTIFDGHVLIDGQFRKITP